MVSITPHINLVKQPFVVDVVLSTQATGMRIETARQAQTGQCVALLSSLSVRIIK